MSVAGQVSAGRVKYAEKEARALLGGVAEVLAARGKKYVRLDPRRDKSGVMDAILGPSGNLRAPAMKAGKRMLVGFTPEMFGEVFG